MIHVIAIITAKPGKRDEVLSHFKANVPAVHAEKGCIEYGATVDTDGGPCVRQQRSQFGDRQRRCGNGTGQIHRALPRPHAPFQRFVG